MKKILVSICLFLTPFLCYAAEPSQESIEKLLTATQAQKMVEGMIPQIDGMMRSMTDQALNTQNMSPEEREKAKAVMASMMKKMMPVIQDQMSWEKLKKMYIPIYQSTFTQEEIDSLIGFYSTPAGKALIEKMPIVMQKSMASTQQLVGPMLQQIQKAAIDAVEEVKQSATTKQ